MDSAAEPWGPKLGLCSDAAVSPKLVGFLQLPNSIHLLFWVPKRSGKGDTSHTDFSVVISKAVIYLDFLIFLFYFSQQSRGRNILQEGEKFREVIS